MIRNTERILTTHTGSLPRPPDLLEMLLLKEEGQQVDKAAFDKRVSTAVSEAVRQQADQF